MLSSFAFSLIGKIHAIFTFGIIKIHIEAL